MSNAFVFSGILKFKYVLPPTRCGRNGFRPHQDSGRLRVPGFEREQRHDDIDSAHWLAGDNLGYHDGDRPHGVLIDVSEP